MKLKAYLMLGLAALAFSSCDESFNDWGTPATNTQGAIVSFGNGSIAELGVINLADVEGDEVQVCQVNAPTANPEEWAQAAYEITFDGTTTLPMDANGQVNKEDLQNYIINTFGRAPEARELVATAVAYVGNGTTTTKMKLASSEPFKVTVIPNAPIIEEAYYLVGTMNGWDTGNTDYKLTYSGDDRYANPNFSITLDIADTPEDIFFKVCPESAIGTGDDAWGKMITAIDGDDTEELTGNYGIAGGAFKVTAAAQAGFKKLKINFNMMTGEYSITPVKFDEFIYGIGNGTDWSRVCPFRCDNGDGEYYGYIYINGEWKFRPLENDWGGTDWGGDADGNLVEGGNIPEVGQGPGYYRVKASLNTMKWEVVEQVTTIGLIGGFADNNWASDVAKLEYNPATGAWEGTAEIPAGVEFKFRVNDAWTYNWGGTADNLTQDGANLTVATGGTYNIQLFAFVNGKAHVVLTLQ